MNHPGLELTIVAVSFISQADSDLPMLAWIARVEADNSLHVRHGDAVEVQDRFFVAGVWAGDFATGDVLKSSSLFGSGGAVMPDAVGFATPIATTDWLFEAARDGVVHVSNSLPLLLSAIDDRLDPGNTDYATINDSMCDGIADYIDTLPTRRGIVHRHIHRNLIVSQGRVIVQDKPLPPTFADFAAYRDMLHTAAAALALNARDPARRLPMPIYSVQSKGYDSTACNAVLARYGIDTVFTITQGRGLHAYADRDSTSQTDDDGTEIATALGLPVVGIDRRSFERPVDDELLFWAGIHRNFDLHFIGIHDAMRERAGPGRPVVLSGGVFGEVWNTSESAPQRFTRRYRSGSVEDGTFKVRVLAHYGLSEVQLEVGYIQLNLAYIGARHMPDIVRISNSDEMAPWRCVPGYDRPIARRLAEEAGVAREMFGQVKMGTVADFPPPDVPRRADLRRRYDTFVVSNRLASRLRVVMLPLVHRYNTFAEFSTPRHNPIGYYVKRIYQRMMRCDAPLPRIAADLDQAVFAFSVNELADRYAAATRGS